MTTGKALYLGMGAILAMLSLTGTAHGEDSAVWRIEDGWLVAEADGTTLLIAGEGPALSLSIPGASGFEGMSPPVNWVDGGFDVIYETGEGITTDQYRRFEAMGHDAWLRTVVHVNTTGETQDLTQVQMRLAPAGATDVWKPRDFWMGAVGERAVCVAYRGAADHYHLSADANGVSHGVSACWRLEPGQRAVVGAQAVWLGTAGTEAYRAEARRWFEAVDLLPPALPGWLAEAILYETCAGGHVDARFSDVGGFENFRAQVPYLGGLGITGVWLQSVHTHKVPPSAMGGWNLYDPRNFEEIDPILGGPEALRILMDDFDAQRLKVIGELVPHGGHSVQADALPEWQTHNRDGKPAGNWGGASMDYSSPPWQALMRRAAERLASEFGMVGVRIDVADGSGPNWNSPRTNHASYSTLGGAVELLQAIHQGLVAGGTEGLLLPESFNTMEFFRETPLAYGHPLWFLVSKEIPRMIEEPDRMVKTLRDFFEDQRGAYPPGSRIIRTLNNHDTVVEAGRVMHRYGAGLSNALWGVCLMVPGVPMMYQEEEIGLYDVRRTLNLARRSVPEFAHGTVDYFAVEAAPEVFSCMRAHEGRIAVGLSNLGGQPFEGPVRIGEKLLVPDGVIVYDAVSGRQAELRDHAFPWRLEAYETALIRVAESPLAPETRPAYAGQPAQAAKLPPALLTNARYVSEDGKLALCLQGDAPEPAAGPATMGAAEVFTASAPRPAEGEAPVWELRVADCKRWYISGRTALLSDYTVRRHGSFPEGSNYAWDRGMAWGPVPVRFYARTAPTGRLWESFLEPLHPEKPAIAFEHSDGTVSVLSGITTNARHLVLFDADYVPGAPEDVLALRFYLRDPLLPVHVAAYGWTAWQMAASEPTLPEALDVSFQLERVDGGKVPASLMAPRLPVDRNLPRLALEGADTRDEGNRIWFMEPGAATWSRLDAPAGEHRIALILRHSERNAEETELTDAYTILVNGEAVPFAWEKLNVHEEGNAHFGLAVTEPVVLNEEGNTLRIETTRTWCGMRMPLELR